MGTREGVGCGFSELVLLAILVLPSVTYACNEQKQDVGETADVGSVAAADNSNEELLPPGHAKQLVELTCTSCHQITRIVNHCDSKEGWRKTVEEMRSLGAYGSESDMKKIVKFLSENLQCKKN